MNLILDEQGDGESLPDTPPNEASAVLPDPGAKIANKTSHPFSLDIKVSVFMDIIVIIIIMITSGRRHGSWSSHPWSLHSTAPA